MATFKVAQVTSMLNSSLLSNLFAGGGLQLKTFYECCLRSRNYKSLLELMTSQPTYHGQHILIRL
jgi:hypothetical protein